MTCSATLARQPAPRDADQAGCRLLRAAQRLDDRHLSGDLTPTESVVMLTGLLCSVWVLSRSS